MQGIGSGLQQCSDKGVRVAPGVLRWTTPLGLRSEPSWTMGPSELALDVMDLAGWVQPGYDISFGQGPQRKSPHHQQQ